MSFIPRNVPRSLDGVSLSDVVDVLKTGYAAAAPVIQAGAKVISDPYLPEVTCRLVQLSALENRQPVPACPSTPMDRTGGIGLRKLVRPLRAAVYAEQHPWVKPVALLAAIGIPVAIGYALGRKSRRSP